MKKTLLGMALGFVIALAVLPLDAGGSIIVTQGINKATYDFCEALIAAKDDQGSTEPAGTLQTKLDVANETAVTWTRAGLTTSECTVGTNCMTEVNRVCVLSDKGSTGKSGAILVDPDDNLYCSGQCVDGDWVHVWICT